MNSLNSLWARLSLRARVLLLAGFSLAGSGLALHLFEIGRSAEEYREELVKQAQNTMNVLDVIIGEEVTTGDYAALQATLKTHVANEAIDEITWHDRNGQVLGVANEEIAPHAPALFRRIAGLEPITESRGVTLRGTYYGRIKVRFSSTHHENLLWDRALRQVVFLVVYFAALFGIIWMLIRNSLRPLEGLAGIARHFLAGDYAAQAPIPAGVPPEIRDTLAMMNRAVESVGTLVLSLSEVRRATDNAAIVVESDLNGVITYANEKFCEISGYSQEELVGQDHRILNSGYHPSEFFSEMWDTINSGEVWRGEVCNQTKSGGLFWADTTITPIIGANGRPVKFVAVRFDITARKLAEGILWQQAQVIDQAHDAVFSMDSSGMLVSWNKGAERLFGFSKVEVFGKPVGMLCTKEERGFFRVEIFQMARDKGAGTVETKLRRKSGERFDALLSLTTLKDHEGKETGMVGYAIDITQRKLAEEALRQSEASLARAQHIGHIGDWDWNIEQGTVRWSAEAYRIFGLGAQQGDASLDAIFAQVHPDDREFVKKAVNAALAGEAPLNVDHRIVLPDGSERIVHTQGEVVRHGAGKPVRLVGTVQDITERKKTELELRESREQLRELSSHIQTAREQEKAKIAREIHDELGSTMTALKMDTFWLMKKLPPELEPCREKVASMTKLVDSAVQATRRIATELRPTMLDDIGLVAALEWQAEEFQKRLGIECVLSVSGGEAGLDEARSIALFRIFQEALTNITRHAQATRVAVDLRIDGDGITMSIADNGRGVDKERMRKSVSHGVRGMFERARHLGGDVTIDSTEGQGTIITVRIPRADSRAVA